MKTLASTVVNFPARVTDRVDLLCEAAREREDRGEYEEACELLAGVWNGPGARPNVGRLDDSTAGALLMRAGSLTGWLGSKRQVVGYQEKAKDLLSEAAAKFEKARALTGWGWVQKCLALSYWREGHLDEARAIAGAAVERVGGCDARLTVSLELILGMVEVLEGANKDALNRYLKMLPAVQTANDDLLTALYHNGLENARENLGDIDGAIIEATAAIYFYEQAGNPNRQVLAINNLANLYRKTKCFEMAHAEIDRAERIAVLAGDELHQAHLKDTRALTFLAEGKNEEAERVARASVAIFERGDETVHLVRSLCTRARALARLKEPSALENYMRAYALACEHLGRRPAADIGMEMFQEVGGQIVFDAGWTLDDAVNAFEGSIIKATMDELGTQTAASLRLGIQQQTLSAMLHTRHKGLHLENTRRVSIVKKSPPSKKRRGQ